MRFVFVLLLERPVSFVIQNTVSIRCRQEVLLYSSVAGQGKPLSSSGSLWALPLVALAMAKPSQSIQTQTIPGADLSSQDVKEKSSVRTSTCP